MHFEHIIYPPIPRGIKFYKWSDVSEWETPYKHTTFQLLLGSEAQEAMKMARTLKTCFYSFGVVIPDAPMTICPLSLKSQSQTLKKEPETCPSH